MPSLGATPEHTPLIHPIGIKVLRYWTGLLLLGVQSVLVAQSPSTATRFSVPPLTKPTLQLTAERPHTVRWWEVAGVVAGTLAFTSTDEKVTHEFREDPTRSAEDIASVFRRVGQPEVYAVLPLVCW